MLAAYLSYTRTNTPERALRREARALACLERRATAARASDRATKRRQQLVPMMTTARALAHRAISDPVISEWNSVASAYALRFIACE